METFIIVAILTFPALNGASSLEKDLGPTMIVRGSHISVCNNQLETELSRIRNLPEIRSLKTANVRVECRRHQQLV